MGWRFVESSVSWPNESFGNGDVNDLDNVCKQFLCSINSVKVLRLNHATALEGFTPAPLCTVSTLHFRIQRSIDDNLVPAMTSLFRAVPNFSTLEVSSYSCVRRLDDSDDNVSGFDKGYWELQKLDFVSKLEEVAIEFARGSNGFELASYILEHACNLKKLSVITTPDQSSPVADMLRSNATSTARVVFVDKVEHLRSRV